jgi:uncharacterized protein
MKRTIVAAAAVASLVLPAAAGAHVTVQPREVPAGAFTRLDVRVPNEKDDQGTTKVDLQLPDGFAFVSYEPRPGWTVNVEREKLDKPIEIEPGFEVDEQVTRVTFTGDGKTGIVNPGEFTDFGLSVRTPAGKAGDKLTFKALQTYEKGEVVRWIGAEDADEPAPVVTLTEAGGGHGAAAGTTPATTPAPAAGAGDEGEEEDDDDALEDLLPIIALIVGGLGLIAGLAALSAARKARPTTA